MFIKLLDLAYFGRQIGNLTNYMKRPEGDKVKIVFSFFSVTFFFLFIYHMMIQPQELKLREFYGNLRMLRRLIVEFKNMNRVYIHL